MQYTVEQILRLAKRYNNTKRLYSLVNPIQGKHVPSRASEALEMMRCLGEKLAARYPAARLVIGFAETATAIGAAVADCFGEDCVYIHTTREKIEQVSLWVNFLEEHSHATDQNLCGDFLSQWLERTPQVIIIDDELSTGKTVINMVNQLRRQFPQAQGKTMVAASLINRLSEENLSRFAQAGIVSECLLKLSDEDYTKRVADYEIEEAEDFRQYAGTAAVERRRIPGGLPNPRTGLLAREYTRKCEEAAAQICSAIGHRFAENEKVLVLGTEECMYPALILGRAIEKQGLASPVISYATTRSPIGICSQKGYPVHNGAKLGSLYEEERITYLYNLDQYGQVIIVSDSGEKNPQGLKNLAEALNHYGCKNLLYWEGKSSAGEVENHV